MVYTYKDITYNKRPLTDDISLWAASNDKTDIHTEKKEYEELVRPYKTGELAGQQDSCPVQRLTELVGYVGTLKKEFEGFRIRNSQFSGIVTTNSAVSRADVSAAPHYIASGSIAVIAKDYEDGADTELLRYGILPLRSDEEIKAGTFVFIRNIKRDILKGGLESYTVTPDGLQPLKVYIDKYPEEELKAILENDDKE